MPSQQGKGLGSKVKSVEPWEASLARVSRLDLDKLEKDKAYLLNSYGFIDEALFLWTLQLKKEGADKPLRILQKMMVKMRGQRKDNRARRFAGIFLPRLNETIQYIKVLKAGSEAKKIEAKRILQARKFMRS